MITEHHFDVAGISNKHGQLVINSLNCSIYNKFYNVHVLIDTDINTITVNCEKSEIDVALFEGEFDINLITEDSIELYKPWFGKPYKRSTQYVEFLKREPRTYQSNNYVLIT